MTGYLAFDTTLPANNYNSETRYISPTFPTLTSPHVTDQSVHPCIQHSLPLPTRDIANLISIHPVTCSHLDFYLGLHTQGVDRNTLIIKWRDTLKNTLKGSNEPNTSSEIPLDTLLLILSYYCLRGYIPLLILWTKQSDLTKTSWAQQLLK